MTTPLAWGARVSPGFRAQVVVVAQDIDCDPSDLMACMAWESGETFSASIRNAAGSGAVGLIQFMPATAGALGTTTDALRKMTAEAQLDFVAAYFRPFAGRLKTLCDLYMAILWPAAVGKKDGTVLFSRADPNHPKLYLQNKGLDWNDDGLITRADACRPVLMKLGKGLRAGYVYPTPPSAGIATPPAVLGGPETQV